MISVIVPVYNEEESLKHFFTRLLVEVKKISDKYEIIFVDDGSKDTSLIILKSFTQKNPNVRIFSFRRNQGKSEALTAGFQMAKGETIVTLDADLQDRPEEIEFLLKKMEEGYDVVSGWRKERKDASKMVIASKVFNFLARILWGISLHDYNCGLKVYTSSAAKSLHLYGGMHRFIPLLCFENGFAVSEVAIVHEKRKFGKSKYGFSKTWKDLPDMFTIIFLTRYGKRPLHFFGTAGMILSVIGLIFIGYLTFLHYFMHETVGTRPLWSIGVLFTLVGLQVLFTGFLADLIINISQNRTSQDSWKLHVKYSTEML